MREERRLVLRRLVLRRLVLRRLVLLKVDIDDIFVISKYKTIRISY